MNREVKKVKLIITSNGPVGTRSGDVYADDAAAHLKKIGTFNEKSHTIALFDGTEHPYQFGFFRKDVFHPSDYAGTLDEDHCPGCRDLRCSHNCKYYNCKESFGNYMIIETPSKPFFSKLRRKKSKNQR